MISLITLITSLWEEYSGEKKPKWLRETLKDALKAGTPSDKVRAIKMPDRLGMVLVACTQVYEPSNFEEASHHSVWIDSMMDD